MTGTYGDTRMTLTQLYAQDRQRVGDTNGNNQAGLACFLVARLACAPSVVVGAQPTHMRAFSLAARLRVALLDDTTLVSWTGSSRPRRIKYEEVTVTGHCPGTTLRRNPFR
jgi:hypothetical protein